MYIYSVREQKPHSTSLLSAVNGGEHVRGPEPAPPAQNGEHAAPCQNDSLDAGGFVDVGAKKKRARLSAVNATLGGAAS